MTSYVDVATDSCSRQNMRRPWHFEPSRGTVAPTPHLRVSPHLDGLRYSETDTNNCYAGFFSIASAVCASLGATMQRDDRIKKRMLSGASSEKLAPRPGTTSTVQRVCAQRLN